VIERTRGVPDACDETVDVLVIGAGCAGLAAAAVAAEEGLSVLVVEKLDLIGGATSISGGGAWIPNTRHGAERGVVDSRERALTYLEALSGGALDDRIASTLLDRGPEMAHYLEDRLGFAFELYPSEGPTHDYRPHLQGAAHGGRSLDPGRFELARLGEWASRLRRGGSTAWTRAKSDYYVNRRYLEPPGTPGAKADPDAVGSGASLVGQLLAACLDRGVEVVVETAAEELIAEDGRVIGAVVASAGGRRAIRARAGVVLATGGYEFNEELRRLHLNRPLTHPATPVGTGEGDGLALGLSVGAEVAGLGDAWWSPTIDLEGAASNRGGGTVAIMSRVERCLPHTMIVNRDGRRFANEAVNYYDFPAAFGTISDTAGGPANLPAWVILDQQYRDRYALIAAPGDGRDGNDPAWVRRADSLADLAALEGIDATGLARTVERFNGFARSGVDEDFHRGESEWDRAWGDPGRRPNPSLGTIEQGPFYALRLQAGAIGTKGGLRVDGQGQVLGAGLPDGAAIPGLYAAGNVAACSVPWGYAGPGATLGPALTFGYVIGRALAVAERPVIAR
jgi:succinate dehydrogenase/fumarate reductase flavoprotein subunit